MLSTEESEHSSHESTHELAEPIIEPPVEPPLSISETHLSTDSIATDIEPDHEQHYLDILEKRKKSLITKFTDIAHAPETYIKNSEKEVAILDYLNRFSQHYSVLYPNRIAPMIVTPNEFGTMVVFDELMLRN
jgi:hypothetical protein